MALIVRFNNAHACRHSAVKILLVASLLFAVMAQDAARPLSGEFCPITYAGPDPGASYCIAWQLNTTTSTIYFTQTIALVEGWVAVGLSRGPAHRDMMNSDIYIMWVDGDQMVLTDRKTELSYMTPPLDVHQDGTIIGYTREGGTTTYQWMRAFETGDMQDYPIEDTQMTMLWAYRRIPPAISLARGHAANTKGSALVNFYDGTAEQEYHGATPLRITHGVFMTVAWVLLALPMVMVARYGKSLGHKWFLIHRGLSSLVFLLTVIGFIIALVMVDGEHIYEGMWRFTATHKIMGLITIIGVVVQPVLGYLADKWYDPKRTATPTVDKSHWWFGRFLILNSLICMYLGVYIVGNYAWPFILVSVVIVIYIIISVYLQCTVDRNNHGAAKEDDAEMIHLPAKKSNSDAAKGSASARAGKDSKKGSGSGAESESVSIEGSSDK